MELSSINLTTDVLYHCFKMLPFPALAKAATICKAWKKVAYSDALWIFFSKRDLPRTFTKDPFLTWKNWYQLIHKKPRSFSDFHLIDRKIILVWGMCFSLDEIFYYLYWRPDNEVKLLKTGHISPITCSRADLKNGKVRVVTGSFDQTIKISFKNGVDDGFECLQTLTKHKGMITAINYNESYLFSGSSDKTVMVWNFNKENSEYFHSQTLEAHTGPISAIYAYKDPGFPHFFSASKDTTIVYWSKVDDVFQKAQVLEEHKSPVTCLTVSLNDNLLISGDEGGRVKIWGQLDDKQWHCIHTINAHEKPISSICCKLYRGIFCTAGGNELKIWKKSNNWEEPENTFTTDCSISEVKMGSHIADNNSMELLILTDKELQLAYLSEKGIEKTAKRIEFSH